MDPIVTTFFDEATRTASHVVREPRGHSCAIVDPVLDYDPASARTGTQEADRIAAYIEGEGLKVAWILETHAHADHLSAAPYLQARLGGVIAIGARIPEVQTVFRRIFNLDEGFPADGQPFGRLFAEGDTFRIGALEGRVLYTPGHTPACVTYVIGTAAFIGDTLFAPDYGTARCDFPGGDARVLYDSIQRILALPDDTRLFLCHDYAPGKRAPQWEFTVADQKAGNVHLKGRNREDFVALREARDATLELPKLILPSIQVNIRAGHVPEPEANGVSYLKIPLNLI